MIKSIGSIGTVKDKIATLKGKDVSVKVNLGRNRTALYMGKLNGVYSDIFTVKPYGDYKGKTSYSYSEIICGNVVVADCPSEQTNA